MIRSGKLIYQFGELACFEIYSKKVLERAGIVRRRLYVTKLYAAGGREMDFKNVGLLSKFGKT